MKTLLTPRTFALVCILSLFITSYSITYGGEGGGDSGGGEAKSMKTNAENPNPETGFCGNTHGTDNSSQTAQGCVGSACPNTQAPPPFPTPGTPTCTITASKNPTTPSQNTTLTWKIKPAGGTILTASLSPGGGAIPSDPNDSRVVSPNVTTTYKLTGKVRYKTASGNVDKVYSCSRKITVNTSTTNTNPNPNDPNQTDQCSNIAGVQTSVPAGHIPQGGQCIATSDVCPNIAGDQGALPSGYVFDGSDCVPEPNQCQQHYYCSGASLRFVGLNSNNQCTDSLIQVCDYGCNGNECNPVPTPTLDISVNHPVINPRQSVEVTWEATNVTSCSVAENNADITDSWSGAAAGCSNNSCNSTKTSAAIAQQTTYTLTCTDLEGDTLTDSVQVSMNPFYDEI